MEPENLEKLYDESILQENRQPYHFEKRTDADLTVEAYNPLCGDQFKLFLYLDNGAITSAYFHGYGCAVSKASTSILTRELEGCTVPEASGKCTAFLQWLAQQNEWAGLPASWKPFAAARQFPGRLACAQLAWDVIAKAW